MSLLVLGLLVFLGVHSVSIFANGWRDEQVRLRGEKVWKGLYTLVAVVGLVLIVVGYGQARQSPVVLYTPPAGMRHAAWLLMLPVFVLLFASNLPGRIQDITKHPMLLATKLWATAHLLANGTLADVLLFGGFLVWAVLDRISVKRRPVRPRPLPARRPVNDVIALVGGLAVYAWFIGGLHVWLIGVSPR